MASRSLAASILTGMTLLLAPALALADPVYNCEGVGVVVDPSSNTVLSLNGQVVCVYTYDATLSLIGTATAASPLGSPTTGSYTYDSQGNILSETTPGVTAHYVYDATGYQLQQENDSSGRVIMYQYDTNERLTGQSTSPPPTPSSDRMTSYQYDFRDRLTSTTDAASNVTQYQYDATSNLLTTVTDPTAHVTQYVYNATGQVTMVTSLTDTTQFVYDGQDRLSSVTDDEGSFSYAYDAAGLLDSITGPVLGDVTTFSYDAEGLMIGVNDPTGDTVLVNTDDVPEPGSLVLFATALAGLGPLRRRRKRT